MRNSNPTRRGLSVIEAVVACALLVLLAVLVLPAVERARGSAMGNHTKNTMRRVGIGISSYHATYNAFPAGQGKISK
jgi:hypothetical protein